MEIEVIDNKDKEFSPEDILGIDLKEQILISLTENNKYLNFDGNNIHLLNQKEIYPFQLKQLDESLILDYNPNIKWSIPKHIRIEFIEPERSKVLSTPYFSHIYKNTKTLKECKNYDLKTFTFSIYLDHNRFKNEKLLIGEKLLELDLFFHWKFINTERDLTKIIILKNNYAFQEFEMHFEQR